MSVANWINWLYHWFWNTRPRNNPRCNHEQNHFDKLIEVFVDLRFQDFPLFNLLIRVRRVCCFIRLYDLSDLAQLTVHFEMTFIFFRYRHTIQSIIFRKEKKLCHRNYKSGSGLFKGHNISFHLNFKRSSGNPTTAVWLLVWNVSRLLFRPDGWHFRLYDFSFKTVIMR